MSTNSRKPWTSEDDENLTRLRETGWKVPEIARLLRRGERAIEQRLEMMSLSAADSEGPAKGRPPSAGWEDRARQDTKKLIARILEVHPEMAA